MKRLSLRDNQFRPLDSGQETHVFDDPELDVVIVDAAPVSRQYYAGEFDPSAPKAPTCWSDDTARPSPNVPEAQREAVRCIDCPKDIRGSGSNGGRACRYSQRIVVSMDEYQDAYALQLSATSVFGSDNSGMPLQAYAKFLAARNVSAISVVTRMSFDRSSHTPKLFFRAVRPLEQEEFNNVRDLKNAPDTKKLLQFETVVPQPSSMPFSVVEGGYANGD